MEIERCSKGHFFDAGKYKTCPLCDQQNTISNVDRQMEYHSAHSGFGGINGIKNVDKKENINNRNSENNVIEEYGATQPVRSAAGVEGYPLVGWLVCVKGNSRGESFRIHSQYNYIGRAAHMDICLSSDPTISKENAAILAYDNREKTFYMSPGGGHNLIYVNGMAVLSPVKLNSYDIVSIGETELLFKPLCVNGFDWDDQ